MATNDAFQSASEQEDYACKGMTSWQIATKTAKQHKTPSSLKKAQVYLSFIGQPGAIRDPIKKESLKDQSDIRQKKNMKYLFRGNIPCSVAILARSEYLSETHV